MVRSDVLMTPKQHAKSYSQAASLQYVAQLKKAKDHLPEIRLGARPRRQQAICISSLRHLTVRRFGTTASGPSTPPLTERARNILARAAAGIYKHPLTKSVQNFVISKLEYESLLRLIYPLGPRTHVSFSLAAGNFPSCLPRCLLPTVLHNGTHNLQSALDLLRDVLQHRETLLDSQEFDHN